MSHFDIDAVAASELLRRLSQDTKTRLVDFPNRSRPCAASTAFPRRSPTERIRVTPVLAWGRVVGDTDDPDMLTGSPGVVRSAFDHAAVLPVAHEGF